MSIPLSLLKKVRCRFLSSESGTPVADVVASLSLSIGAATNPIRIPVGSLCSDQAGYLSFDLKALIDRGVAAADHLWLSSPRLETGEIDLLGSLLKGLDDGQGTANRLQSFEAFGPAANNTAGDDSGFCLVFPVYVAGPVDTGNKQGNMECTRAPLPAIQAPDACDYRASPYSFVTPVNASLGDGCCETLVPSSLPLQEHRLYKVVVRREDKEDTAKPMRRMNASTKISEVEVTKPLATGAPRLKFAEVLEFMQRWYSLGHSLGEIKYSLALAPGEATQIAIIDWSREDNIARTDNVAAAEYMDHSLKRDRSIEETIDSALRETQGGNSFMAGTTGQATIPLQSATLSFNGAIGGSVSNSWGNRNLEADSLQDIHDRIRQQTGYTRSLNSTVIVQATQSESNVLQTRKVANHNHCHALTIQYYEVLRHYLMQTEFAGRRKALLVPFRPFAFTWQIALQFRTILENVLLDTSLQKCFDALFRLNMAPEIYDVNPGSPAPATTPATSTSPKSVSKTLDVLGTLGEGVGSSVFVNTGDSIRITASGELTISGGAGGIGAWSKGPNGDPEQAPTNSKFLAPGLRKYSLIYKIGTNGAWQQAGSYMDATADADGEIVFGVNDEKGAFEDNKGFGHDSWSVTIAVSSHEPAEPAPPANPTPAGEPATTTGYVRELDEFCANKLLTHLNGNQGHYNSSIWILQNPVERRIHLNAALANYPDVLDALDDTPIAVSGNYVAFPYDGPSPQWQDTRPDDPKLPLEDVVTLPTRGLFAEAQLGHCNACEERDPTRMWDWNEMTIETPPDISGVTPGPKGQTPSVTPAALPGNVIQITQPPSAPDPTGLAAALKVLGTPDIFRDMSGLDEVSKLLDTLSKESSEANIKALAILAKDKLDQAKSGPGGKSGSSGTSGSSSGQTRTPASETDAAKQVDRVKAIEYAQSKGLADVQTAQDATKGVLGGEVIPTAAPAKGPGLIVGSPSSSPVEGIDVSDGDIRWDLVVRAGFRFAFIRASYGQNAGRNDIRAWFMDHWNRIKQAGIIRGAYHFFRPSEDAEKQATEFIATVGRLYGGDLPPVLDLELDSFDPAYKADSNKIIGTHTINSYLAEVDVWLTIVQDYFKLRPIIYTSESFWKDATNNSDRFTTYPLWVNTVNKSKSRPVAPHIPDPWADWDFWQYSIDLLSNNSIVPGVDGKVDLNLFNGTEEDLLRFARFAFVSPHDSKVIEI